jgi:hypothetical protein
VRNPHVDAHNYTIYDELAFNNSSRELQRLKSLSVEIIEIYYHDMYNIGPRISPMCNSAHVIHY